MQGFNPALQPQLTTSNKAGGATGLESVPLLPLGPSSLSHPNKMISTAGGSGWSAAFHSSTCRWARLPWRRILRSVGGRCLQYWGPFALPVNFHTGLHPKLQSSSDCIDPERKPSLLWWSVNLWLLPLQYSGRSLPGESVNYFSLLSHNFLWLLIHFSKQLTHFSQRDTKHNWFTMATHCRHFVAANWNCSLNSKN